LLICISAKARSAIRGENPRRANAQRLDCLLGHACRNPILAGVEFGDADGRDEDGCVFRLPENVRKFDEGHQGIVARRGGWVLCRVDDHDPPTLGFLLEQPHPSRAVETDDAVQVLDQAVRIGVLRPEKKLGNPLPPFGLIGQEGSQIEVL
jgi:hypothetical protein